MCIRDHTTFKQMVLPVTTKKALQGKNSVLEPRFALHE